MVLCIMLEFTGDAGHEKRAVIFRDRFVAFVKERMDNRVLPVFRYSALVEGGLIENGKGFVKFVGADFE